MIWMSGFASFRMKFLASSGPPVGKLCEQCGSSFKVLPTRQTSCDSCGAGNVHVWALEYISVFVCVFISFEDATCI